MYRDLFPLFNLRFWLVTFLVTRL